MFERFIRLTSGVLIAASCFATNYTSVTLGPTPDQPTASAVPTGLNNAGQVVGIEYLSWPFNGTLVVWNAAVPSAVPLPSGYQLPSGRFGPYVNGPFINESGQILAQAVDTATTFTVGILWTAGTPIIIGPAPNTCGATSTAVYGLNAAGHILGTTSSGSCQVFWTWSNGTFTTFNPPEPTHFLLAGINDAGHVFGIICAGVPNNGSCTQGPIVRIETGKPQVKYQIGANFISPPNNLDQATGFFLAGPGQDPLLWMSPTTNSSIPPGGRLTSCCYTNVNNAGYLVFSQPGAGPYAIQHESSRVRPITGNLDIVPSPYAVNDGIQFLAGGNLLSPAPANCAADVTSQIAVNQGQVTLDPSTGRYQQTVNLTNNGAALASPVSLLLDQLAPKLALYRLAGSSTCTAPYGVPYTELPSSFGAAGSQAQIQLQFVDQDANGVSWTPRVVAGSGGR